jgi:hypothetical protein
MYDWMHYTAAARCLGYPSDSSRAARERARGTSSWRHPRLAGQARPDWIRHPLPSLLACAASLLGRGVLACVASIFARVACLSLLACVGHRSLAIGLIWLWVVCRATRRRAGSPGIIAGPYRHCRLRGRAVGRARAGTVAGGSPSAPYCLRVWRRGAGLRSCAVCWAATAVADRQRRAASPVSGIQD